MKSRHDAVADDTRETTLSVRLTAAELKELDDVLAKVPALNRSTLVRAALARGLADIAATPALALATPTLDGRARRRAQ